MTRDEGRGHPEPKIPHVRVSWDEQIFAIQRYGGISRMFSELARVFASGRVTDVELTPLSAPIVNRFLLDDPTLATHLDVSEAPNPWVSLARYFARRAREDQPDLIHNTFYLPRGLSRDKGPARVVTVHDMIPELLPGFRRRLDWLTLKKAYVLNADHVICVSEATKQDLIKVYGLIKAPISVVHHGVDARFKPDVPRLDFLPEKYVLFVGNRTHYKDADVLYRAFQRVSEQDPDVSLLCVGGEGLGEAESARLRDLGIRDRVSQRFLGDDSIISAYANAEAFVFPSHFEGFGLPAVEAMACGAPTILARATSLPEVGGDAALYFDPGNSDQLAGVISDVLRDSGLQGQMRSLGVRRAQGFTWLKAAESTASIYRDTAGAGRPSSVVKP